MPKISVIIPAYNSMTYLPETLNSVLQQSYTDFEVIIVNDGSSDHIEQWVSQITDSRIQLISQKNQGLAGARNTGIAHARSEYLAFLDADDLWEPTKLEKQLYVLEKNPEVGLVYTWVAYIDEYGRSTGRVFKHTDEGNVWATLTQHNIVECGSVAMVRSSCFETCGVFDQGLRAFGEDWDMWLRIASRYPFRVVKESLVYYRQHANSASKDWSAMEAGYQIVIEKAFASASPELLYLKARTYGFSNLCLAWKPLQSKAKDYKQAIHFRRQAFQHYPWICFSKEYLRLSIAIMIMRWFGADGYQKFLAIFYAVRRNAVVSDK